MTNYMGRFYDDLKGFVEDFKKLRIQEEENLSAGYVVDEIVEKMACLAYEGGTTYTYETSKYRFNFAMKDLDDIKFGVEMFYRGYEEI